MEPSHLNELPFWFQIVAGLGLFFGTASIAILGWIKKNVSGGLFGEKEDESSAVVLSAAIADSAKISELARSIDRLTNFLKEDAEDDGRRMDRLDRGLVDVLDEVREIHRCLRQRTLV